MPDEIRGWIGRLVRRELARMPGDRDSGARLEIATRFVAGAFFEVMHWRLDETPRLSPAQVDELFQQLAFDGVSAVLAAPSNA